MRRLSKSLLQRHYEKRWRNVVDEFVFFFDCVSFSAQATIADLLAERKVKIQRGGHVFDPDAYKSRATASLGGATPAKVPCTIRVSETHCPRDRLFLSQRRRNAFCDSFLTCERTNTSNRSVIDVHIDENPSRCRLSRFYTNFEATNRSLRIPSTFRRTSLCAVGSKSE